MASSTPIPTAFSGVSVSEPVVFPAGLEPALRFGHEPPEHFVQFFEDDRVLLDALVEYVTGGLENDEACIVVATRSRLDGLRAHLEPADLISAVENGQVTLIDAHELLERLVVDDHIDRSRFHAIVGGLVDRADGHAGVRVFGEMVAILWGDGRRQTAIDLEQCWNDLQDRRTFTLFCAYPFAAMSGADSAMPFEKICRTHTRIVPPESYSGIDRPADRLRSIVEWQQKAQLLELEVRERKIAEQQLHSVKEELEQQVEDLRQLHEISAMLSGNPDETTVLDVVLRGALAVQHTNMGMLLLCENPADGLSLKAHNGFDRKFLRGVEWIPYGSGSSGAALAERRRIIIEDTEDSADDSVTPEFRMAARRGGFRACHSTPLITRTGKTIGVLSVHFEQPHRPSERETQLLDLFSLIAANAIENATLHRRAQHEIEERQIVLRREQDARVVVETANRLKDEFLATVSHELRTPLTAIIGWAHMLRENALDPAITRRAIETIERAATSQAQLIEDMLDVSRIIAGNLKLNVAPIDPVSVVESAVRALDLAATSKSIDVVVTIPPDVRRGDRPILGDAMRLQQVVWNLVSNAIKFTPNLGHVSVSLGRDATSYTIEVRDSGEGIEADFLPYLFDRFRQADGSSSRRHQGLGLGLAIVRHLVEMHGGTILAASDGEGRGATFTVRLPIAVASTIREASIESAAERALATRTATLEGLRVLVVDNDDDTVAMLRAILEDQHAEVRTAGSASEAFEMLRSYEASIIISDLAMPGEDGYSFIRRLRGREGRARRPIPAIALTAYVRVEDRRAALAAGFNMFVPKPVEPSELISTIANLADRGPATPTANDPPHGARAA